MKKHFVVKITANSETEGVKEIEHDFNAWIMIHNQYNTQLNNTKFTFKICENLTKLANKD